jgi:hypothetical protein
MTVRPARSSSTSRRFAARPNGPVADMPTSRNGDTQCMPAARIRGRRSLSVSPDMIASMTWYQNLIAKTVPWPGVLDADLLPKTAVAAGHHLADAAKQGDWPTVMMLLEEEKAVVAHQWRPGGSAWFTVLHQAAWHGAPPEVTEMLIKRGALRCLRDAKGRTAFDVAAEHDQSDELRTLLKPKPSPLAPDRIKALDVHLAEIIDSRAGRLSSGRTARPALRYPPVEILHELPQWSVWFPVPGMHGGFHIDLRLSYLEVLSWNLEPGGSLHMHVITHQGAVLVSKGPV